MTKITKSFLKARLNDLGRTPDEIANKLHAIGIVGMIGSATRCPLAVFLKWHGAENPLVDMSTICCGLKNEWGRRDIEFDMPDQLIDFIDIFDRKKYPQLRYRRPKKGNNTKTKSVVVCKVGKRDKTIAGALVK